MESNELLQMLEAVQDTPVSHVDLSASTKRIKVDMETRNITGYAEFGVIKDHLAETIVFEVARYKGDTDLAQKSCAIHWENGENGGVLPVTEVDLSEAGHILMRWELSDEFTQHAGSIAYALHFFSILDGGFTYHAATNAAHGKLGTTLNASAHSQSKVTPSEIEVYIAKMNALSAKIDQKLAEGVTDEQVQIAVEKYLTENPIEGGVDEEQLNQAVEDALQKAKDSGEFDGADGKDGANGKDGTDGKSAYEYAQTAGYNGTEEEFAAKLAEETYSKEEIDDLLKNLSVGENLQDAEEVKF